MKRQSEMAVLFNFFFVISNFEFVQKQNKKKFFAEDKTEPSSIVQSIAPENSTLWFANQYFHFGCFFFNFFVDQIHQLPLPILLKSNNQLFVQRSTYMNGDLDFIRSLTRCKTFHAKGGKSGAGFLKTFDERFILKTVSEIFKFFCQGLVHFL
jgi:hypothetical protein